MTFVKNNQRLVPRACPRQETEGPSMDQGHTWNGKTGPWSALSHATPWELGGEKSRPQVLGLSWRLEA